MRKWCCGDACSPEPLTERCSRDVGYCCARVTLFLSLSLPPALESKFIREEVRLTWGVDVTKAEMKTSKGGNLQHSTRFYVTGKSLSLSSSYFLNAKNVKLDQGSNR